MLNAHHDDMELKIPEIASIARWTVVFDTVAPSGLGRPEELRAGDSTPVKGRSVAVLVGTDGDPLRVGPRS